MLHDPAREDPRAREWADREMQYVQEIASLKAQLAEANFKCSAAISERAKVVLELNKLRRDIHRAAPPKRK